MKRMIRCITFLMAIVLVIQALPFANAQNNSPLNILSISSQSNDGYIDYEIIDQDGNPVHLPSASNHQTTSGKRKAPQNTSNNLPTSYDSRTNNCITTVKTQGTSGCCWAFATLSALESDAICQGYDDLNADYSEAHLAWYGNQCFVNNSEDSMSGDSYDFDDPYSIGGNWLVATAALSRWSGVNMESSYPFDPLYDPLSGEEGHDHVNQMGNYDESDRYQTDSGLVLKSAENLTSVNDIKQWIMDHGSVTASFYADYGTYETAVSSSSGKPYCNTYFCYDKKSPNHEIAIVGWNDDFPNTLYATTSKPSNNGAWLVKDSWGDDYHLNGYFWMSYEDCSLKDVYGFSSMEKGDLFRNYSYNGAGFSQMVTHTGSCKVANVFQAKGQENLKAVSFYTCNPDQNIVITVYKLSSTYSSPVNSSSLQLTQNAYIKNSGYHTVTLNQAITLSKDEYFSVVIEYVAATDSTVLAIPVEYSTSSDTSRFYASAPKTSYAYLPAYDASWRQMSSWSGFKNVMVQAFTECVHNYASITDPATCTQDGNQHQICSVCGKTNDIRLPATGHHFGPWSAYKFEGVSGYRQSHRYCYDCGFTETRTVSTGSKVVTLPQLFEMIFKAICSAFQR